MTMVSAITAWGKNYYGDFGLQNAKRIHSFLTKYITNFYNEYHNSYPSLIYFNII